MSPARIIPAVAKTLRRRVVVVLFSDTSNYRECKHNHHLLTGGGQNAALLSGAELSCVFVRGPREELPVVIRHSAQNVVVVTTEAAQAAATCQSSCVRESELIVVGIRFQLHGLTD